MPALVSGGPGNLTPDELLLRQQAAALQTGSPFPFGSPTTQSSQGGSSGSYYGLGQFRWPRAIGSIIAHVTVSEEAVDLVTITEHPVESNAPISDHAYINPPSVIIRCGWANSRPDADGTRGYVRDIYAKLLQLQAARVPFDLLTGKRTYKNMLIRSLMQTTDAQSEETLMCTIVAQQVMIVETRLVTVPDGAKSIDPLAVNSVTQSGDRQLKSTGSTPLTNEQLFGVPAGSLS